MYERTDGRGGREEEEEKEEKEEEDRGQGRVPQTLDSRRGYNTGCGGESKAAETTGNRRRRACPRNSAVAFLLLQLLQHPPLSIFVATPPLSVLPLLRPLQLQLALLLSL